MPNRYCLNIRYLPEQVDNELLAGRCLSILHGFLSYHPQLSHRIGVSFPLWNEQTVGNVISFIASQQDALVGLSFQPYFGLMVKEELFAIEGIDEVTASCGEVQFIRNQTIDKTFMKSKKRRMARALAKNPDRSACDLIAQESRTLDTYHGIPISSHSTGQQFVLHIQRQYVIESLSEGFNTYGFATNALWQGTVPQLNG